MKETIAKFDWLTSQQCSAMAWYEFRAHSKPPTVAERFRMEQGQETGAHARRLYPDGILVSTADGKTPVQITQDLIANCANETLFEATLSAGPFVAKADVLRRQNGTWHVLEVKSSFSDTSKIEQFVDDLAYTVMVFKGAGLAVAKASLLLISRNYRFGDGPDSLFDEIDKTADVLDRLEEFERIADSQANVLFHDAPPPPMLVSACRNCEYFAEECLGAGLAHTVLEIPGLHYKKLQRLSAEGIVDLSCVPDDIGLNARQEKAKNAAISGKIFIDAGLGNALSAIAWPCHYLDFETVATVLPLYPGYGCHQQVLTQFSIHHRDSIASEVRHSEYLADATRDCQRELAEALISAMPSLGSIIVYSPFEETRIKALQQMFPDLNVPLQAILDRLVDLHSFITAYVYHPEFLGSSSIKNVLPVLVPDLSYRDLAVADGDTAITQFARMARGEITGADIEPARQQLLEYCKLDTFAMVRLHEALGELANSAGV